MGAHLLANQGVVPAGSERITVSSLGALLGPCLSQIKLIIDYLTEYLLNSLVLMIVDSMMACSLPSSAVRSGKMCPHFCGSCMMKSCALAARAAASIAAMLASVSAAMLRAMVVANSVGSWLTSPIRDLVHVPAKV